MNFEIYSLPNETDKKSDKIETRRSLRLLRPLSDDISELGSVSTINSFNFKYISIYL